ncbi:MAG: HAMP domain-containing histidine kinase [Gammaproteobacteria bacterium]|nr:HAMP domain-containing histidine kinase [Gammaproteobacteria bacterium]
MSQINPFKSSAVRITLVYVVLFGLSVAIILGFIYWSTIVYQTNQTDEDINAEIKALSTVYASRGYPGLIKVLSDRIEQQRPGDSTLYLLTDHQFRPLVGNINRWPPIAYNKEGWLNFKLDDIQDKSGREFSARARTFEVENRFNLLVGQGMKDLQTMKALVGSALVWGLLLTIGLGLVGGMTLQRMLRLRLGAINQTSRKIMQGDLRKRIQTRGTGDEFDQLALNLNSMLDQIERGMEGVRRVSDNIAHDLKTPLARLKNRVEELKVRVAGEPEEETVDSIIQEADGLLQTFNALLRIARIEYSEQRKEFVLVDINSILRDLQELYEPLIEEKGQSLRVELSQPMEIPADRDMLFQAFANLIDNAIKYTPEHGEIVIRAYAKRGRWYVEICDNGPGIPASEYEKVIQRFYRLDQSRTSPGSGLGLALVVAVLKLHQLELSFADNQPGLKVCITITPPRRRKKDKPIELLAHPD